MSKKNIGGAEVSSARSKLDGVLQTLVDKKDDSQGSEDETESGIIDVGVSSPVGSPRKQTSRTPRKRRRRADDNASMEAGQYHHTYVLKLFDRSVDLAQFEENTPLYPICRAWMRNQPLNRNLGSRPRSLSPQPPIEEDDEDPDKLKNIYKMPDQIPRKKSGSDLRIPTPVPQSKDELNIYETNVPAPEQLLLNHMSRWKSVRLSWKKAAKRNEAQFKDSYKILKEMYDRTMKEN
ncbi:protein lin-37 homolog [Tubulanus polymorphus]|uniref:protein lin-37 homolog n=1 Tax=Tubulanus polymorphus TaxID=672921 RepID=UPI003DA359CA